MKLQERISILYDLGQHLQNNGDEWLRAKNKAFITNPWFIPGYIELAVQNITRYYLDRDALAQWAQSYNIPGDNINPSTVGLTMAGNIPLVGFHDWLTIFLSGHYQLVKPSSKDDVLIGYIFDYLHQTYPETAKYFCLAERLNGCNAYIATGSNNSARYFEYYFGKYPNIIRKNRTSAAILTGLETPEELSLLADDILLYFGLGCRNVSKIFVPKGYDFEPLLRAMDKFAWMKDHTKYRNNYDYQLSLLILNNKYYMCNEAALLVENKDFFSPISQVNYEYYHEAPQGLMESFGDTLQCVCGKGTTPFGRAQYPQLADYADGVDTMAFALGLKN